MYARYLLVDSVSAQWAAFKRGFDLVCTGGRAMNLFVWQELELLICGSALLDFQALERGARYDSRYSPQHPTVQRFWRVVHSLSEAEKRLLLHFATGSDRAPIGGLSELHLVIVFQPDSERLPSAHTCFNHLLLPDYQTEEKMRRQLLLAISNAEGFGMM